MGRKSAATMAAEQEAQELRFNMAVAEKVNATIAAMLPNLVSQVTQQVADARAAAGPVSVAVEDGVINLAQPHTPDGDRAFASALALQIANLASQGTGRAPFIPPERLEGWSQARERMMALLAEYRGTGRSPKYRVVETCFFNETRIFPQWHDKPNNRMMDTYVHWDEPPNLKLEPANEEAQAVYAEYLASIAELPSKRPSVDSPWVQSDKRLFKGMSSEQREAMYGLDKGDPRVRGEGAPIGQGRHEQILGNVAPPAVMR